MGEGGSSCIGISMHIELKLFKSENKKKNIFVTEDLFLYGLQ
jgi:hypothetical protein